DVNAGSIVLDPKPLAQFTNGVSAIMEATNGGNLILSGLGGGSFINFNTIRAVGTNSMVALQDGASVQSGTFSSSPSTASVRVQFNDSATLNSITNTGVIQVQNGASLTLVNSMVNTGTLAILPTSGSSSLVLNGGTTTLSGGGTVVLGASTGGFSGIGGSGTLLTDNFIRGSGIFGQLDISVRNAGTIRAEGGVLALATDDIG